MERLGLGRFQPDGLVGFLGRNDNWAGRTTDGLEVFVEAGRGPSCGGARPFRRVCAFEDALAAVGPEGWSAPRFLAADQETLVLAFEKLDGACAGHVLADEEAFGTDLSRRAGQALAEVHSLPVRPQDMAELRGAGLPRQVTALTLDDFANSSWAELEAWALIQHDEGLNRALHRLREESDAAERVPSHCDLRLDQFLLAGASLWGSESCRRRSSRIAVFVDDAAKDAGAEDSSAFEPVHADGLLIGARR